MPLTAVGTYDSQRVQTVGQRAVVVGASMAGLLAGRVLADAVDEVVVLERDSLGDEAVVRRGVPQSAHVHALLEAGRHTLEALFPGYGDDLTDEGGLLLDANQAFQLHENGGFLAEGPSELPMYCASRPLLEALVRRRLGDRDSVTLRDECHWTDFLTDGSGAVRGVAFRDEAGEQRTLDADLVVDATGRTSKTPQWLSNEGFPSLETEQVDIDLAYGTARLERPSHRRDAYLVSPSAPDTRGGAVLPVEGDRWLVTLFGLHGDHPPTTPAGLREFAAGLATDEIHDLLATHDLASSEITEYRFPANRRRHYERLDRFPEGLVVTGDALASFNPIYGQGMSVAALDALALHESLAADGLDGLAPRFFDRATEVVDTVWRIAVGSDFEYEATSGPKPVGTGLTNSYVDRVAKTAQTDGYVAEQFTRVLRLEVPPTRLLHPDVLWRVLLPI